MRPLTLLLALMVGCSAPAAQTAREAPHQRTVGEGPPLRAPRALRAAPDGSLLVIDDAALVRVTPRGGHREVLVTSPRVRDALPLETGWLLLAEDGRVLLREGGRDRLLARLEQPTRARRLNASEVVVLDPQARSVVALHLETGARRTLAEGLLDPADLEVAGDRVLVLLDRPARILEVGQGPPRVLHDLVRGPGPALMSSAWFSRAGDGRLLVADTVTRRVLEIAPDGRRRVLLDPAWPAGVRVTAVAGVAALPGGAAAVALPGQQAVARVGSGGQRSVLSGPLLPNGSMRAVPKAVAWRDGELLVVDVLGARLLDGEFREISGPSRGSGPLLAVPVAVQPLGGSRAVVSDRREGLVEVDLASGRRRGLGRTGEDLGSLAPLPGGALAVADPSTGTVRASGGRRIPGLPRIEPAGLAWASGALFVADFGGTGVYQVAWPEGPVRRLPLPRPGKLGGLAASAGTLVVGQEGLAEGGFWRRSPGEDWTFRPGRGEVSSPSSLALAADGRLAVADPEMARVLLLDPGLDRIEVKADFRRADDER